MPTRLLAFGDSLTAGYYQSGNAFAPWAPLLKKLLLGVDAVDHIGLSGLTAMEMWDSAEDETVRDVVPLEWPGYKVQLGRFAYDVVIILCGTNDLSVRMPTKTLIASIASLHGAAHATGARTVAMTIPESKAALHVDWLRRARLDANAAIRTWASAQPGNQVHLVDAASLIPYSDSSGMWEPDGLHMTAAGYERFGRGLAPLIADFVAASTAPPTSPPPAAAAAVGGELTEAAWRRKGTRVRVIGLAKAAHHNGKVGQLNGLPGRDGRLGVLLEDGQILAIRRHNLELSPPSPPLAPLAAAAAGRLDDSQTGHAAS